jgi:hypothetical protein
MYAEFSIFINGNFAAFPAFGSRTECSTSLTYSPLQGQCQLAKKDSLL